MKEKCPGQTVVSPTPGWPKPMGQDAMCGLLGDIVRTISPHSEADPAALLLQTLVAFGNVIGRRPHFKVEADYHAPNLFAALVGKSARGRKGTSWGYVFELFRQVDKPWARERVQPGLSTGEGLIKAISDIGSDSEPHDKRLLVFEDELSAVLRVMSRWTNILSTTLRHSWDGRTLQVMTRESPLRVSDAHVSIVAQTTQEDLHRYLNRTDVFNGFSNRFLWACTKRSKLLPDGGGVPKKEMVSLARRIKRSVEFAKRQGEIGMSENAVRLWRGMYSQLSADNPGPVDAATSRAEAQVRRIALVCALMDESSEVRTKHLRAALEIWRFCKDSAEFIFSSHSPVTVEGRILTALRQAANGLTRTEINQALQHHVLAAEISRALHELKERGLVRTKTFKTGGRSAEYWVAVDAGTR